MTDPLFLQLLCISFVFFAGFGMGALWMDTTRTVQAKDRRAARREMQRRLNPKAFGNLDIPKGRDWTGNALENS